MAEYLFRRAFIEEVFGRRDAEPDLLNEIWEKSCAPIVRSHRIWSFFLEEHVGIFHPFGVLQLEINPDDPLPFASPGKDVYQQEQEHEFDFLKRLNGLSAVEYPGDAALKARIKSYELAFRMQMAVPEAVSFKEENEETKRMYGLDQEVTKPFGEICLAARRLSERGVRFGVVVGAPFYPWYYPPYYSPYYYPPAVAAPAGPQTYIEQGGAQAAPAQSSYWYYCAESKTYYPYVKECPGGWQRVTPQPAPGG